MDKEKSTITLTFSERIENHVGMQQIGQMSKSGFTLEDLQFTKKNFEDKFSKLKPEIELINLNLNLPKNKKADDAYILIIRDGVNLLLDDQKSKLFDEPQNLINSGLDQKSKLFDEHKDLDVDKQAFMYGRVVNKNARHNLCFADFNQEPDYSSKKGRIISFDKLPLTKMIRDKLPEYFGPKTKNFYAEGNYYYDVNKTGIGFHGDTERKYVLGVRLGREIPLHYQWYQDNKPIGKRVKLSLKDGDIYMMSEKATGFDWKKTKSVTIRHAAGAKKFLTIKKKTNVVKGLKIKKSNI